MSVTTSAPNRINLRIAIPSRLKFHSTLPMHNHFACRPLECFSSSSNSSLFVLSSHMAKPHLFLADIICRPLRPLQSDHPQHSSERTPRLCWNHVVCAICVLLSRKKRHDP